jgi:hypothetical protein
LVFTLIRKGLYSIGNDGDTSAVLASSSSSWYSAVEGKAKKERVQKKGKDEIIVDL